jgi:Disulfide bond formation protein DsbB
MNTHPTAPSDLPERSPRSVTTAAPQRLGGAGPALTPFEPAPTTSLAWCALVLALLITGASLWLSLGMHLVACPLCLYQRTFIMGVAAVLLTGLLSGAGQKVSLGLLALPLALAGLVVASFHFYLELSGTLECPQGLFQQGSAPKQSVMVCTMLVFLLLADAVRYPAPVVGKLLGIVAALVVAGGCAYGLIVSGPKLPDQRPTKPYDPTKEPLLTCRRPFKAPEKP